MVRVNGPVVHLTGLGGGSRFEFVEVGEQRLPGEILTVDHDLAVAQLYEYAGGLQVGAPAWATGHPLTVELGPGLLGGIYDGLLRPLEDAEVFLPPRGLTRRAVERVQFEPVAQLGDELAPGDTLGQVVVTGDLDHIVLVPTGVGGHLDHIAEPGLYESTANIAAVNGIDVSLTREWPVRQPRPYRSRNQERAPFRTGQRVLDLLAPISRGSSATVIGGFGAGRTMLLEQIAK